ncbi:hypothetical protein NST23_21995 [Brevibacillus sp. FSL K6-0770]|uniref:hypothetical protein n=1 Tax=Brevibacillus TaxID=55080 RepID=UPI000EC863ED|nr:MULTISPECIES: hypothetical protein [Brevibacillus]MDH6350301.1 biotin carboxyl carrier protein [Brevibacillus sp. 1238]MDR5001880.1 hypothetical protein [Brevibacillus parabrevis]MED2253381.1 hypothetical protein [Brevibacillus parabrevis]NRQ55827.1 hypothetical protein [Brevibacillus sp. HD1.4A]HBZ79308.1 hypothetical protein [Brevibacillus sp.]
MGLKYDVVSPFAGTIERIFFQLSDSVQEGELLFTLAEGSRRMDILSPVTGSVEAIEVESGEPVIAGMILASIVLRQEG